MSPACAPLNVGGITVNVSILLSVYVDTCYTSVWSSEPPPRLGYTRTKGGGCFAEQKKTRRAFFLARRCSEGGSRDAVRESRDVAWPLEMRRASPTSGGPLSTSGACPRRRAAPPFEARRLSSSTSVVPPPRRAAFVLPDERPPSLVPLVL
ncbi:hypothetical protein BD626DRAFT_525774, partial [Schizophyllum amplum]